MRTVQKFGFLLLLNFYLYGCGGGSPSSSSPSSQALTPSSKPISSIASSSSSSRSSASSSTIKVTEVIYHTDVNQPITIKTQGDSWLADKDWYQLNMNDPARSASGKLASSYADKIIYYIPDEGFQGQDEFYYWDNASSAIPQRVKVTVNVGTETIKQPKWPIDEQLIFTPGTTTEISAPMDADSAQFLVIDETAQLSLNGKPITYTKKENTLLINIPMFERAGIYKLSLQQGTGDTEINVSTWIQIAMKNGEVTYYIGNKDFIGSTLVVVRTNEVDDQEYQSWIKKRLIPFLREPLIRQYQDYWSFAVIDSPADRKINLYGNIGVADTEYYSTFVSHHTPRNTEIIVIDGQLFRATGGYPITMNTFNEHGVLFHEIGHAHAKLGDEYSEDCIHEYHDTIKNPNIEKKFLGALDPIQWKHWIKDPLNIPGYSSPSNSVSEVGVFLGAFFCSDKYYRPTLSSLMKSPFLPPNAVHKEAWILANYENLGLLESVVSERKNSENIISITKDWNPSLTSIRWFINDNELTQFEGHKSITIDETTLAQDIYSVKAELIDLTGQVINPHAYYMFNDLIESNPNEDIVSDENSRFKRTFTFNKSHVQTQKKLTERVIPISNHHWVKHGIRITSQGHTVEHSTIYDEPSISSPLTGASDLLAEVVVDNKIVFSQGVELKQFHLPEQITPQRLNQFYTLKHPVIEGPYQIKVYSLPERQVVAAFDFDGN